MTEDVRGEEGGTLTSHLDIAVVTRDLETVAPGVSAIEPGQLVAFPYRIICLTIVSRRSKSRVKWLIFRPDLFGW